MNCKICGSCAINPGQNGRGEDRLDLCDVCYWREGLVELQEVVRWERSAAKVRNDVRLIDGYGAVMWAVENLSKARAAVDALVGEG